MTMFAPAFTARRRTSIVASEVVTTPVTGVDGSPALNVSTVDAFQSTPTAFRIRSTISCAVTAAAPSGAGSRTNGAATAPAAPRQTNSRREMRGMARYVITGLVAARRLD